MMRLARSETERSVIRATAMTEARSRNQIGQPAAWTIANNAFPYRYFGCLGADCKSKRCAGASSALQQEAMRSRNSEHNVTGPCSGYCDIHKKLWISLWIAAE